MASKAGKAEGIYWLDISRNKFDSPGENQKIPIYLTRKRVRHLRLRITDSGEFHLSIPWRAPLRLAEGFIEEQRDWITAQQDRYRFRAADKPRYETGDVIPWWGANLRLEVQEKPGRAKAEVLGEVVRLTVPPGSDLEKRQRTLDKLRKNSLETRLAALLPKWAAAFEVEPGPVRIRRMKSRWGSCNPRTRALTFNLELTTRDPKYLEYVIAHELTHYFFPNHGPEFHALLASKLPAERSLRRELNGRGANSAG